VQLGEHLDEVVVGPDESVQRVDDPSTVSPIPLRSFIAAATFSATPARSVTVTGQNHG
jgi:hypothetical protein